jgi:hypothetical protein
MTPGDDANRLAAEARARVLIDRQLTDAGWSVQDSRSLNVRRSDVETWIKQMNAPGSLPARSRRGTSTSDRCSAPP